MRSRLLIAVLLGLLAGGAAAERPQRPLEAIGHRMVSVESMLRREMSGREVQREQERILAELDRMIRERDPGGATAETQSGLSEIEPAITPGAETGRPDRPAEESVLPSGRWEPGRLSPAEALEGDWRADLPEAGRRTIEDTLGTGRLPARYRDLLRAYNLKLAEREGADSR